MRYTTRDKNSNNSRAVDHFTQTDPLHGPSLRRHSEPLSVFYFPYHRRPPSPAKRTYVKPNNSQVIRRSRAGFRLHPRSTPHQTRRRHPAAPVHRPRTRSRTRPNSGLRSRPRHRRCCSLRRSPRRSRNPRRCSSSCCRCRCRCGVRSLAHSSLARTGRRCCGEDVGGLARHDMGQSEVCTSHARLRLSITKMHADRRRARVPQPLSSTDVDGAIHCFGCCSSVAIVSGCPPTHNGRPTRRHSQHHLHPETQEERTEVARKTGWRYRTTGESWA